MDRYINIYIYIHNNYLEYCRVLDLTGGGGPIGWPGGPGGGAR